MGVKFDIEEKGDEMDKMLGGYQALQIRSLNGRIFQKLLSKEPDAQDRSEQGKILTVLWQKKMVGQRLRISPLLRD